MDELRELVMDLDRYYYYGRHPAFEQQMAKIRKHLSRTAPVSPSADGVGSSTTGS